MTTWRRLRQMGIQLVSEDEAARLPASVLRLELRDFDFCLDPTHL